MLRHPVKREGKFTPIPKHERAKADRRTCACCGSYYGQLKRFNVGRAWVQVKQILDHIIPRRWLEKHGIYEHDARGLVSICQVCHGKKKTLEDRLYQGDVFSFLDGLKKMNYPMERVLAFTRLLGLKEFDEWRI
jgi:hypothetical protein